MRRQGLRTFGLALLLSLGALAGTASGAPAQGYVVFFKEWSAAFDAAALNVIAEAAQSAKGHPGETATVTGAADRTGSKEANALLSRLRAQVVADQLAEDGLDPSRIRQAALGSVESAMSMQESRRVVIVLAKP